MAESTKTAPFVMPMVLRPGGVLLLLAFLRWRQPEGRLLGMLAVVPQTTFFYEMVPLLLIPRTWGKMALLVVLTTLAFLLPSHVSPMKPGIGFGSTLEHLWPFWLILIYLPALVIVLRTPPEVGATRPRLG